MLTYLQYKCVNKQTRLVRVRRVFKVRNFRTRTLEKSADPDLDVRKALIECIIALEYTMCPDDTATAGIWAGVWLVN
jgi:hypothetical protein